MVSIAIIGVTTVIFGIASLFLVSKARNRLSEGSLRKYMDNFAVCLTFIVIFSLWQTFRTIYNLDIGLEGLATYPEYIFIVFAYAAFIITSYRIIKLSEEFGFKEDGTKIKSIIPKKKTK